MTKGTHGGEGVGITLIAPFPPLIKKGKPFGSIVSQMHPLFQVQGTFRAL
jgi:hypothetical protein